MDDLSPLQEYYVTAINLAVFVGGFVAVVGMFLAGFLIVRSLASWK